MASTISFKKAPAAKPAEQPAVEVRATPVDPSTPPPQTAAQAVAGMVESVRVVNAPASSTALAAPTSTAVGQPAGPSMGGFEGEYSAGDMATPYLQIMQKQSKNFDEHPDWLGQWVYDKQVPLGEEIKVVFLRSAKSYIEKTEFGSEVIPQRFTQMQEARKAGFNESDLQECADLDLLIEVDAASDGAEDLAFIIEEGKAYILARYSVRSTAYGKTVGILLKDASGFLTDRDANGNRVGDLKNGFYMMSTDRRSNDKTSWYVPVLKTAGKTPAGLRQQINDRFSVTS